MNLKIIPSAIAIIIGLLIWFVIPIPKDIDPNAWHLLAIFVATIAAIIGKAMPIGALAIISITIVATTGITSDSPKGSIVDALSSFDSSLIWLIGIAIMISRGLIKTGLGARIGYFFISLFGKKTLGIAYSLSFTDMIIGPVTPSNTARAGGIIHPITRSIANNFNSNPKNGTEGRIGKYLALVNIYSQAITSGMFVTATAPNPLVVNFVLKIAGSDYHLTWGTWALAMLLPGIIAMLLMPIILYKLCPPEIKQTPDATSFAKNKLKELGPISRNEKVMFVVFLLMLILWANIPAHIFGDTFKLHSTTTAFIGLSIILISGVLSWDDILKEKSAWDTIVWFSALIMMATFLNKLGLIGWFAGNIEQAIKGLGLGWQMGSALLIVIYLYAHYAFASTTAHVTAMFGAFYAAGLALGAPPMLLALSMAAAGNVMMMITHYATGPSPIIFNSGYTSLGEWWRLGFIMSVIILILWISVGLFWWKILGHY